MNYPTRDGHFPFEILSLLAVLVNDAAVVFGCLAKLGIGPFQLSTRRRTFATQLRKLRAPLEVRVLRTLQGHVGLVQNLCNRNMSPRFS